METNTLTKETTLSKEVVAAKMNVALTKAALGIEMLTNLESNLVYNEDNIESISEFLTKARKAKKVVEDEHKAIKEPYLKISQTIDESKRNMLEYIETVLNKASGNYTKLCQDIERRKQEQIAEHQRKQNIINVIDGNTISFSQKITNCTKNEELISIERLINLEKGNKNKYQEFLPQAAEKYESLTALIKLQKDSIKEFERIEKQRIEAQKANDEAKMLELQEKQELLTAKIDDNKVSVQENAINQTTFTGVVEQAIEIMPDVKVRRKAWKWKISDIAKTTKMQPSWVKVVTVDEKIDEFMKASRDDWNNSNVEAKEINGITFYIERSY